VYQSLISLKNKFSLKNQRSSKWTEIRQDHLILNNVCACCGCTSHLEVHHITPFYVDKSLELDKNNLITLCDNASTGNNCHLLVGHLGDWKRYNKNILQNISQFSSFFKF